MQGQRAFERLWYAQAFLRELVLIYPTAAIMMQQRGVDPVALATLFMIWSASTVIFEVPTGVLADRLPRRLILMAAGAIEGCAFVTWWLAPTFWGFAAGFVVWGFGSALRSGAAEAYLHDTLEAQGRAADFERVYGLEQAAGVGGVASALALGGWLAEDGFALPLLLSALAPWSAALLVAALPREPARIIQVREDFLTTLSAGLDEIRTRRVLVMLTAMIALFPTVYDVLEEFVPPLLDELGFSLTGVGAVFALAFVVRAVSLAVAHRLGSAGTGMLCGLFAGGGALLAAGMALGGYLATVSLFGYFALSAVAGVLLQGRLQAAIQGGARATITSVAGLGQELVSLVLYLALGAVAQAWSWRWAAAGAGTWLVLSALAFLVAFRAGRSAGGDRR